LPRENKVRPREQNRCNDCGGDAYGGHAHAERCAASKKSLI